VLEGGAGDDALFGDAGADELYGGADDDALAGGSGNDWMEGGTGQDVLTGGLGADIVRGGLGADIFDWNSVSESRPGYVNRDVVVDFEQGLDRLDMRGIDAVQTGGLYAMFDLVNEAFDFVGRAAFGGEAGELRYQTSFGTTLVQVDVNGDRAADLEFEIAGLFSLTAADFML
jgi:Ca2+-binding RTX toxin-like protein